MSPRAADPAAAAADRVMFAPIAATVVPVGMVGDDVMSVNWSPTRTVPTPPAQVIRFEPEVRVHEVRSNGADVKENVTVPVGTAPKAEGTTEAVKCTSVPRTGGNGEPAR